MRKTVLAAILVAVLAPSAAAKEKRSDAHEALVGVVGTRIVVEDLSWTASKCGLTGAAIRKEVEDALRRNHVPILSREELSGNSRLSVHVKVSRNTFGIDLEHREKVTLVRDPEVKLDAVTWRCTTYGWHDDAVMRDGEAMFFLIVVKRLGVCATEGHDSPAGI